MSESCLNETHDWYQTRTLYVVLQGEFALYRQDSGDENVNDTLRIVAPYLPDHVYKAGPWLTNWEKADELPRVMSLRNAFGDRKQGGRHSARSIPEQNTDIIMSLGEEKPCPQNARLDISAPMPLAILSGLVGVTPPNTKIEVKHPGNSSKYPPVPPYPTLIPILLYKWYADSRPYLWDEGCDGRRITSSGPSDDFQSIQIYASSPYEEDTSHAQKAFHEASRLLGEDAYIEFGGLIGRINLIPATPPAGLSWAQINLFLNCVLEIQKKNPCDPILTRDYVGASELPDCFPKFPATGGPSGNCGPITGG